VTQARGVRYDADGAVGHIVLDRPEAANAMDLPAARALGDAVHAANDASIRAVLLTGEGKRFCAGGDVASFVAAPDPRSIASTIASSGRSCRTPSVSSAHGAPSGRSSPGCGPTSTSTSTGWPG
jgi:2-(1,2-epoxy-1,2-dihydrophenyl)acetyl-CoA isomerase